MISVRTAGKADIPLLTNLEREFNRDERRIVLRENRRLKPYLRAKTSDRSIAQRMGKWIASRNARVLIAEQDSRPCGFSVLWIARNPPAFRPRRYGFIGIMFVRDSYRGLGISSLMMKAALAWFSSRRVKHVGLTLIHDNKHARRIYEKWGFSNYVVYMWKFD